MGLPQRVQTSPEVVVGTAGSELLQVQQESHRLLVVALILRRYAWQTEL